MTQCIYKHPTMGRCEELAGGWYRLEASIAADVDPSIIRDMDSDKPLPLCDPHARMYKGTKVPALSGSDEAAAEQFGNFVKRVTNPGEQRQQPKRPGHPPR